MVPSIAALSLKGGVGKTTVALGLAGAAWARDLSVLVVDLDPQANATVTLDPAPFAYTTGDVLADGRPGIAAEAIAVSGWGPRVHLLPAEAALAHRDTAEGPGSATRLRAALTGVADRYDLVIIDCPPSLGELTRNALAAADRAVVVTEPGFFALRGAAQALDAIEVARGSLNLRLRAAGIIVNRLRTSLTEHRFRLDELDAEFGAFVLAPPIPERTAIQQSQGAGLPVQAWPSPGARDAIDAFDDLLDQLLAPSVPERAGSERG